jgi:hypothetical protein
MAATPLPMTKVHEEAIALLLAARAHAERTLAMPQPNDLVAAMKARVEALRVTARLQHIVAWTLAQKAAQAGEIGRDVAMGPAYALPRDGIEAEATPMEVLDLLPQDLADLCARSFELYERVLRLTRLAS